MIDRLSDLADKLIPLLLDRLGGNFAASGTGAGALPTHALSSTYHTGTLAESQAPWVDAHITNAIAQFKPHGITDAFYHAVTGAQYSVVGLPTANTLGVLESSDNPGSAIRVLRSTAAGGLTLNTLTAATKVSTPLIDHSSGFVGIFTASPAYPLDVTGDTRITGDLIVTESGTISGGVITPSIDTATGNLTLSASGNIMVQPDGSQMRMASGVLMQTDNYVSQLTGWRHTYAGELDTRYIYADQLKIKLLIADLQQALAGSQIIGKSVSTLSQAFIAPRPGGSAYLYVHDLPSAEGMAVFEAGDTVRISEFSRAGGGLSVSDCWGVVTDYLDEADKQQRWFFTRYGDFGLDVPTMTGPLQTANDSVSTLTVTKVTGTASGNLSIACVLVESTTVVTTPPTGWETITTATVTGMRATIYKHMAGGSEPSSYTWTHDSNVDSMVILLNYTNQDPDAPVAAYIANPNDSTAAFSVIKSLTPVSDTDLYLAFVAVRANRDPIIQPDGWSLLTTGTAGGNTLAAMTTLVDGYAGVPFGDVSADLTGGTARTISFTIDIIPKPIPLDLETGFMAIGAVIAPEAFVLDYGVSGNGWHEITAIDGLYGSNSPYSRVVSWTGHPATGAVLRTQDGNLKGLFAAGNEYGFYAGDGTATSNKYLRLSNINSIFNNIPIKMYSGGTEKIRIDTTNGIELLAPSSFLDDMHTISWRAAVGSGSCFGRIYNLITNAGLNDQTSTVWIESVSNSYTTATQSKSSLFSTNGTISSEIGASVVNNSGSQTASIIAKISGTPILEITSSTATFSVGINANSNSIASASSIGIGYATPGGAWTTSNWTKAIEFANQGTAIVWRKATSGVARGIGASSDGVLYFARSTASDNSAAVTYDMYLDTNGGLIMQPAAGTSAIYIATPSNQTASGVYLATADNGSSYGPFISINRNSNASTPAAGWIQLVARTGVAVALWIDNAGNMRLNTGGNPTNANDTSGTVVGTQTSSLDSKEALGDTCTPEEALQHILEAAKGALRRFKYKNGSYNGQEFEGIITDFAPRYGMDRDASHPAGKSLNIIQVISDLILSVRYLSEKLITIEENGNDTQRA